jgi:hypothetical protein
MAQTHSQDLEARFTTLHSNFTETQQEVRDLSTNIPTINQKMHSSIAASIMELKQDLKQHITTHLESVTTMICAKLHIPADLPLSDPPFHTKGETSSHSQKFQPHHFQCDLCLLRVDVTKFDGSDPTGWVTQMEHYLSMYGIMDFRTEGMSNDFFRECFISGLKDDICTHVLMAWPQSWVDATKRAKEAQHVVSSQNQKPSFIPRTKPITPTPPSTPLKIQKLTRAETVERQLKGLCYNCDDKYFLGHKCKEKNVFMVISEDV